MSCRAWYYSRRQLVRVSTTTATRARLGHARSTSRNLETMRTRENTFKLYHVILCRKLPCGSPGVGSGCGLRRRVGRAPYPLAKLCCTRAHCISRDPYSDPRQTRIRTAAVLNRSALEALEKEPDKRPVFFNRSSATNAMVPLFGA